MITREEAVALASVPLADPLGAYARTVVALYDERDKAPDRRLLAAIDDINDEVEMAHRARLRAEQERDALRAEMDSFAAFHRAKTDALALEIRRLRAAEAPGTDDAAFEGTGWDWLDGAWVHVSGPVVGMDEEGLWTSDDVAQRNELALDAMRAAVPGSV